MSRSAALVTDDAKALREQLEAVTGERISALKGIVDAAREAPVKTMEATRADKRQLDQGPVPGVRSESRVSTPPLQEREIPVPERGRRAGIGLGL